LAYGIDGYLLDLTPYTMILKGPLAGCSLIFLTLSTLPDTTNNKGLESLYE